MSNSNHQEGDQFRSIYHKPLLPAQPSHGSDPNFKMARATPPIVFDSHYTPSQADPNVQSTYHSRLGESPDPLQGTPEPAQSVPVGINTSNGTTTHDIKTVAPIQGFTQREQHPIITPTIESSSNGSETLMGNTIEINQGMYQLSPGTISTPGQKLSGRHHVQYVMADGRVINGKGLGRGRPGVKRGSRKSTLTSDENGEGAEDEDPESAVSLVTSPHVETGKRKRSSSALSTLRTSELATTPTSKESTPEYNPSATQTRSGRQSQKPVSLAASTPTAASPSIKRQSTSNSVQSPTVKKHPKIKAKVYRGREQFALCEHCLRGYGPPGNVIVFCDACNKCWHQNCHTPQISKEIVTDTKAEWFCVDCDRILHGKKKQKQAESQTPAATPSKAVHASPGLRFGPPVVGAIALPLAQRKQYLQTLSKEKLIDLILHAGDLAPQLPMFETPIIPPQPVPVYAPGPEPQFASTYVTPVDTARPSISGGTEVDDIAYDDSFDEHGALYPKAGEGVKLPPDSVDLHMLLEGPDSRTFSHWTRGMPMRVTVQ